MPCRTLLVFRFVPCCRLAVVKRAGHCPQEEEPQLFADIVTSFLARHAAVQGAWVDVD